MQLKLHLNKFLKVDNIEGYTLATLFELQKSYEEFISNSEGYDPDFPMSNFGGPKKEGMKTIKMSGSNNIYSLMKDDDNSESNGIQLSAITKAKMASTKKDKK